jgi:tRNA uridine 5-carbamoylmethylation protein Kti12
MRFIVIYGPPAVGKLTTAEELSKLTGYRIFHNHLTIDLVNSILDYGSKEFNEFVDRYRLEMIGAAAKNKVNT